MTTPEPGNERQEILDLKYEILELHKEIARKDEMIEFLEEEQEKQDSYIQTLEAELEEANEIAATKDKQLQEAITEAREARHDYTELLKKGKESFFKPRNV